MPNTRSNFWSDWQRMEADRRRLIARLRDRTRVITRADLTAIARQLEHCTPVPEIAGDTGDTGCAGYEPEAEPELYGPRQAMWEHLVDVARRLDPAAGTADLVDGLPGYQQVRDAIDPEQQTYKGPRCHGMGDALRAISAFDRYHNRPTVTALVKRARTNHPAPGWWDSPGDDERSWPELLEGWQEAVREAVTYWHVNDTTDCEPAFAGLPASWRATADQLGTSVQDVALAFAMRKCADELDAALPTL